MSLLAFKASRSSKIYTLSGCTGPRWLQTATFGRYCSERWVRPGRRLVRHKVPKHRYAPPTHHAPALAARPPPPPNVARRAKQPACAHTSSCRPAFLVNGDVLARDCGTPFLQQHVHKASHGVCRSRARCGPAPCAARTIATGPARPRRRPAPPGPAQKATHQKQTTRTRVKEKTFRLPRQKSRRKDPRGRARPGAHSAAGSPARAHGRASAPPARRPHSGAAAGHAASSINLRHRFTRSSSVPVFWQAWPTTERPRPPPGLTAGSAAGARQANRCASAARPAAAAAAAARGPPRAPAPDFDLVAGKIGPLDPPTPDDQSCCQHGPPNGSVPCQPGRAPLLSHVPRAARPDPPTRTWRERAPLKTPRNASLRCRVETCAGPRPMPAPAPLRAHELCALRREPQCASSAANGGLLPRHRRGTRCFCGAKGRSPRSSAAVLLTDDVCDWCCLV